MEINLIRNFNFFLSVIANGIMVRFQGDILIDHQSMIECLDENGEIELYVNPYHFDTEKRFQHKKNDGTMVSVEEARECAREMGWGDYNILLKVKDGKLCAWVDKRNGTNVRFPIRDMESYVEFVEYDIINEDGKEVKKTL